MFLNYITKNTFSHPLIILSIMYMYYSIILVLVIIFIKLKNEVKVLNERHPLIFF